MQHDGAPTCPQPSELVAMFPGAKSTVKELINECELFLEEFETNKNTVRESLSMREPMYNIEITTKLVMIKRYGNADIIAREKLSRLKRLWYLYNPKKKSEGSVSEADIAKAKEHPVKELVQIGRANNARCVWHTPDKRPSMHLYPDGHVYCFSCNRGGDVIAVYRAIHNCDFITAVRALI